MIGTRPSASIPVNPNAPARRQVAALNAAGQATAALAAVLLVLCMATLPPSVPLLIVLLTSAGVHAAVSLLARAGFDDVAALFVGVATPTIAAAVAVLLKDPLIAAPMALHAPLLLGALGRRRLALLSGVVVLILLAGMTIPAEPLLTGAPRGLAFAFTLLHLPGVLAVSGMAFAARTVRRTHAEQLSLALRGDELDFALQNERAARQRAESESRASAEQTQAALADRAELEARREELEARREELAAKEAEADETLSDAAEQVEDALARAEAAEARAVEAESAHASAHMFLATTSHEIRTPLTGLVGMTDLLGGTKLSEEQRRYVQSIQAASESLQGIVDNVLDYSRIQAGQVDLHPRPVELHDLVHEVVDVHARRAEEKGLELGVFLDAGLASPVRTDPVRVRQILGNLVGNAVKYTDTGTVRIELAPLGFGPDGLTVRFTVTDTGQGVPEDEIATLFEPFQRARAARSSATPGVGLGLSVCQSLTERLGGKLGVDSVVGEGSRFWMEMPVQPTGGPQAPTPRRMGEAEILMLGCSALMEEQLRQLLRGWGADIRTELDVRDLRRDGSPPLKADAALLDIRNRRHRWESELRGLVELHPSLPVIVLSPRQDPVGGGQAAALGAYDALRAPVRGRELLHVLENALAGESPQFDHAQSQPGQPYDEDGPTRVLIADDNSLNRDVIQTYLKQLGVKADAVADGRQAVTAADGQRYDLILMDIHMPELSGMEAVGEIRDGGGPCSRVPIVAITADARSEFLQQCVDAGMTDALAKPLHRQKIKEMLSRWLPGWSEPGKAVPVATDPALDGWAPPKRDTLRPVIGKPGEGTPEAPILTDPFLNSGELVEKFFQSNRETLARISAAMEASDFAEAKAATHYLKSNCALARASAAWETCSRIEELLDQQNLDDAKTLLGLLTEQLERVSGKIRQLGPARTN